MPMNFGFSRNLFGLFLKFIRCLNLKEAETPAQAFFRKLLPERVLGYAAKWMIPEMRYE